MPQQETKKSSTLQVLLNDFFLPNDTGRKKPKTPIFYLAIEYEYRLYFNTSPTTSYQPSSQQKLPSTKLDIGNSILETGYVEEDTKADEPTFWGSELQTSELTDIGTLVLSSSPSFPSISRSTPASKITLLLNTNTESLMNKVLLFLPEFITRFAN